MKAVFNNQIIAESDNTVVVENNHYFPADDVNMEFLKKTDNQYTCPWKGVCDYYAVTVDGKTISDGAFMYPEPSELAQEIKGRYAFWNGVEVTE